MDYSAQGIAPLLESGADQRRNPRKPLRLKVSLGTARNGIVQGQTRDISQDGLSVIIPVSLANNMVCAVRFEVLVDGQVVRFSGHGKVIHCSLAGMEGFRIGMKLHLDDAKMQASLEKFMSL